jgi:hypothetical protein
MTMKKIFGLVSVLLLSLYSFPQPPSATALERLEKTGIFAFGGVGFAGVTPSGEKDFRIIIAQPSGEALKQFEEVYANGNPEGRSYALVGIRRLAPDRFAALTQTLVSSSDKVATMSGCIMGSKPFPTVVQQIAKGQFDFWLDRR